MRSRFVYALPALLLAILAIGLAVFGLLRYQAPSETEGGQNVSGQTEEASPDAPEYFYLLARQDLEPGEVLSPEQFTQISSSIEIEGVFPAEGAPFGQEINSPLRTGTLLSRQSLDAGSPVQRILEDGIRAMAFEWSSLSSVGGLIRPGDIVDVYMSFKGASDIEAATTLLLSGIEVLAVRGFTETGGVPDKESSKNRNATMVLAIPESEVARVALASREADLRFVAAKRESLDHTEDGEVAVNGDQPGAMVAAVAQTEVDPAPKPVFLSDIRPKNAAKKPSPNKPAPAARKQDTGLKVEIFEGGTSRNVYVR